METGGRKKIFMAFTCVVCWFALVLQFYLILESRANTGFSTVKTVTNFFSYFTILSNLLVGLCLGTQLLSPKTSVARFFNTNNIESAIAVYITIVAIVYNTVLRGIVVLTGAHALVNELLHVIVPILYLSWWFFFTGSGLKWKQLPYWLIFPACYLGYSLLRGTIAKWYPYPFLDVSKHGLGQVLINAGFVLLAFLLVGSGILALKKAKVKI